MTDDRDQDTDEGNEAAEPFVGGGAEGGELLYVGLRLEEVDL